MPDLPPMPKPGEVWENDEGERRFVRYADGDITEWADECGTKERTRDYWLDWALRTNARCILPAKESNK